MRVRAVFGLFLLLFLTPLGGLAQGEEASAVVIEGGTLLDGNGGTPVADALIIVRGNRIETVARKGQVPYPPGARVLAQREGIARGKIPGPRLFLAVGSLAGARIAALQGRTGIEGPLAMRQVANTIEEGLEIVRRFIRADADMIKLHRGPTLEIYQAAIEEAHKANLPVVVQPLGPTVYGREAVLAGADIIEHAAGIGYSIARDPSRWKGWGGIEEHSIDPSTFADMDDAKAAEMIRLLVERKVYLEPDIIAQGRGLKKIRATYEAQDFGLLNDPGLVYIPERIRRKWIENYLEFEDADPEVVELREKGTANLMRFIGMFAKAGGKVMTGTDTSAGGAWAVTGIGLHHELDLLVEAGLTPMQALQAATRNVAEGFRILDRLGTIEAGKLADLVIVNADPLQDINNLQQIEGVIQDGKLVDRTFHPWFRNPLPQSSIEGATWVAAVQREMQTMRTPSFGYPPVAIESISPTLVTEGDPTLTLQIRGAGFTRRTLIFFQGRPVPAEWISGTEMKATIAADLVARAGTFSIQAQNPEPLQRAQWGNSSNKAYLLVNFRY